MEKKTQKEKLSKERETYALIVGEQGKGFEKVHNRVKENITVTDIERAIKYIRSTK